MTFSGKFCQKEKKQNDFSPYAYHQRTYGWDRDNRAPPIDSYNHRPPDHRNSIDLNLEHARRVRLGKTSQKLDK